MESPLLSDDSSKKHSKFLLNVQVLLYTLIGVLFVPTLGLSILLLLSLI